MMKLKTLPAAIAIASATLLTACGGSSSSSPAAAPEAPETLSTQYSVAVSAPDSLQTAALSLPQKLQGIINTPVYALDGSDLAADNFAVTIVDTAGNVVEVVEIAAENISQNLDGTWEISVPGEPRLDCIIVVDINAPIEVFVGSPIPADALFTPTTSANLEVDIATTAAYQNFLETLDDSATFEALGFAASDSGALAAVEQLVDDIQDTYEELLNGGLNPDDFSSVAALLEQVDATVATIVQTQLENITNQVEGATLADLFSDGGTGLFWYEAELDDNEIVLERGQVAAPDTDITYEWDIDAAAWSAGESYSGTPDDDLILTSAGWAQTADFWNTEANADGSVTITDKAVDTVTQIISATAVIDLEGLNVRDRLSVGEDTQALEVLLSDSAVFSAGANAYELAIATPVDRYTLWFDAPDGELCWGEDAGIDVGGNCNRAQLIDSTQFINSAVSLDLLISASAGTAGESNIKGVSISFSNDYNIVVEIVEGGAANFYSYSWADGGSYASVGTGNWTMETNGDVEMIVVPVPEVVQVEGDFDDDESTFIFTERNGLVRMGTFVAAGTEVEEALVYNVQANNDIDAATNPVYNDALALHEYVSNPDNAFRVCYLNSNFQEDAGEYDGFGGPVEFDMANAPAIGAVTDRAFDIVVDKCRQVTEINTQALEANLGTDVERAPLEFTADLIANKTFDDGDGETLAFAADGTGELVDLEEGSIPFAWAIENGVLITTFSVAGITGDSGEAYTVNATERFAITGGYYGDDPTTGGVVLLGLQLKGHFINDVWTDIGPQGTASAPGTPVLEAEQGDLWDTYWVEIVTE